MKNLYKKGASPVIIIIIVLILVAAGFYFYTMPRQGSEVNNNTTNTPMNTPPATGGEQKTISTTTKTTVTTTVTPAVVSSVNIDIANFAFSPAGVTIKAGTTVNWTNKDSLPHTVTSNTGLFESGELAPSSGKFSHTFSDKGSFSYHCSFHPNMKGTITVTE